MASNMSATDRPVLEITPAGDRQFFLAVVNDLRREVEDLRRIVRRMQAENQRRGRSDAAPLQRLEHIVEAHIGPVVWDRIRTEHVCRPRRWFMWLAANLGFDHGTIAIHCRRDRSNVCHQIRVVCDEIQQNESAATIARGLISAAQQDQP